MFHPVSLRTDEAKNHEHQRTDHDQDKHGDAFTSLAAIRADFEDLAARFAQIASTFRTLVARKSHSGEMAATIGSLKRRVADDRWRRL